MFGVFELFVILPNTLYMEVSRIFVLLYSEKDVPLHPERERLDAYCRWNIMPWGSFQTVSRLYLTRNDKDPHQRDTVQNQKKRIKVTEATLQTLEAVIDVAIKIVPGSDKQDLNVLSLLIQGNSAKRTAGNLGITPDEVLELAESGLHSLEQLQDRLTEEANIAKSLKESKRHYEQLLEEEREKHRQELRKVNADKRKLQDDIFDVILNPIRRNKFLRQMPVHQLPVSSMLQSLLLSAGYDTLGDVVSRPLQQLSRNVATNKIYTEELKQFILKVGL